MSTPVHEIIFRAVLVYLGLFLLFRIIGKKQLGELSPFDLVLLLIISESVSNALGANENSITGGLISAATLLCLSFLMDYASFKSKKFESLAEGEARILIRDGIIDESLRVREKITTEQIKEALRHLKIPSIEKVRIAILESNGKITAFQ